MKTAFIPVLGAVLLFAVAGSRAQAESWTTTDGQVYNDVKVVQAEPDAVTILHQDGGALVPLAKLSPDLQKRFNYDPEKAHAAAEERTKMEAESLQALREEKEWVQQRATQQAQSETAATDSERESSTATSASTTHHSVNDLATSIHSLRRDLSDPDYHTMGHFWYTSHSLSADSSDTNHHSISEIADSGL
jgi:flagellar basal body rod protein FlgC